MSLDESTRILAAAAAIKAKGITERYKKKCPRIADEIESAATWGAVRAANTYRPDGGQSWDRWSDLCIEGSVRTTMKEERLRDEQRIHFKDLKKSNGRRPEEGSYNLAPQEAADVLGLIGTLRGHEHTVCDLVYREGKSLAEAASEIGIQRAYATKLHQRALARLRGQLE